MTEAAITLKNLGKMYKLYRRPADKVLDVFGIGPWLWWRKKYFKEFWALREVNLDIARGERVGILGPNGAGKSTLLKIITGNLTPTEGTAQRSGKVQALMEIGTGFHPEFTGRQNIGASLRYQGLTGPAIREKEEEIIDFAELEEFIDQPVRTYSAGMYARLAFATATSVLPETLIIDEILGAGDAYFTGKCVERMRNLTERGDTTVLFVSHDMMSIQKLCTRVIWMHHGRVRLDGRPIEVIREYLEHMRKESEVRLRARDMKLSKKNARLVLNQNEVYRTLLLRLRTQTPQPKGKHNLFRAELVSGGETAALLEFGAPMDNFTESPCHVIDDTINTNWSAPLKVGSRWSRIFADHGGVDGHAPFVLGMPAYLADGSKPIHLRLEHQIDPVEPVLVEWFHGSKYESVGTLESAVRGVTATTSLELPVIDPVGSVDGDPTEQRASATQEDLREEAQPGVQTDFGDEQLCVIRGLEFKLPDETSVKVVPLGSAVSFQLRFEALRRIHNPVFAVTIYASDGTQMDHQNTKVLGVETGWVEGPGVAFFDFAPFRLGAGEYLVTAAILKFLDLEKWDNQPLPAYDRHDRRYCLSVFADHTRRRNRGLVVQESSFRLIAEARARRAG